MIDVQRDLAPGTDMRRAIRQQMEEAGRVIILDTQSSAQSSWANYEAGMASALDKPIIVVHAKDSEKSPFIERLGDVLSIEVSPGAGERA